MRWICLSYFFGATSFFALAGGQEGAPKPINKKVVQGDLVILASMPDTFVAGSAMHVKIRVHSNSKDDIRYFTRTKYLDYDLELSDSKGRSVPLTRFGKTAYGDYRGMGGSGRIPPLPAGEHIEVTLNIARVFDLTDIGEYTLSISRELRLPGRRMELKIEKLRFMVVEEPR